MDIFFLYYCYSFHDPKAPLTPLDGPPFPSSPHFVLELRIRGRNWAEDILQFPLICRPSDPTFPFFVYLYCSVGTYQTSE